MEKILTAPLLPVYTLASLALPRRANFPAWIKAKSYDVGKRFCGILDRNFFFLCGTNGPMLFRMTNVAAFVGRDGGKAYKALDFGNH